MLSIIIPSYNSKETILNLLKSIEENTQKLPEYEVIMVDSSDDGTEKLVEKNYKKVKIIKLKEKTPAPIARNIGIKNSKYNFFLFIDSDCELVLSEKLNLEEFKDRISGGFVYPANFNSGVSISQYLLEFIDFNPYQREGKRNFVPSCIMLTPRRIETTEIYFPESLDYKLSEDIAICNLMHKKGIKIFFTKKFGVRHKNREDFQDFKKHISKLGYHSGRTRKTLNIKGGFLKKIPIFACLLIPYRFTKILLKLIKYSFKDKIFLKGFCHLHVLLYFLSIWCFNFYKGLKDA